MPTRDEPWSPGTPCWTDLSTTDPAAARDFYGALFGWELEVGGSETGNYATALIGGRRVCGINGMPLEGGGHPPYWATYLATSDIEASVAAVEANGGTVVAAPMDVMGMGRMAYVQAPGGGVAGLWQAGSHPGFGVFNEAGAVIWDEFLTRDVEAAKAFHAAVFGYTYTDLGEGYSTIEVDGATVGGIGALPPGVPPQVPPHWRVYFAVDDADATVARATELGAAVMRPAADMPYGRHADLADPQGASFAVITPGSPG